MKSVYSTDIRYIAGKYGIVGGTLSVLGRTKPFPANIDPRNVPKPLEGIQAKVFLEIGQYRLVLVGKTKLYSAKLWNIGRCMSNVCHGTL